MRHIAIMAAFALSLAIAGTASAQSKCDAALSKAAGKKVSCKAGVHSSAQKKGTVPDAAKLQKCEEKFAKACAKAQAQGDCNAQTQPCAAVEAEVDACVLTLIASPSGAFLD
jgi:hypothetical protein